jgi:hypothetical protein
MSARFIGVDGEMTGTDGPAVHQLIQIGVATTADEVFVSDIGYDEWRQNEDSMRIHGSLRSASVPLRALTALIGT